ncbi:DUF423 domain-containing protein [Waddlia chondrophila]|uniref:UPF0382 membrane family protein n=2 Tax=Waddlia chondrophila TaxID=71667 RepID=D6YVH5_WADCW|nr:UPF0382 membrane family protein [Waddlia chondrophila WSU 86-1044]
MNLLLVSGTFLSGLGVALGAFGAHYLKSRLSQEMLAIFEVGVRYQIYHSLALCLLGILTLHYANSYLNYAGASFLFGILLFSGSLYALALSGIKAFGAITPIGGVLFLLGWGLFMIGSLPRG